MTMMQLWTAADIAKELGVAASVVANWAYYGRDYMPTPAAVTQGGTKLWSPEQAKQIIGGYYNRKAERNARADDKLRAKTALLRLIAEQDAAK